MMFSNQGTWPEQIKCTCLKSPIKFEGYEKYYRYVLVIGSAETDYDLEKLLKHSLERGGLSLDKCRISYAWGRASVLIPQNLHKQIEKCLKKSGKYVGKLDEEGDEGRYLIKSNIITKIIENNSSNKLNAQITEDNNFGINNASRTNVHKSQGKCCTIL